MTSPARDDLAQQVGKLTSINKAVDEITRVYTLLQQECASLRAEQARLQAAHIGKRNDLQTLQQEVDQLTNKRNSLQQGDGTVQDHTWWTSFNRTNLAGPSSVLDPAAEGDLVGKLNRKLWKAEEEIRDLRAAQNALKREHQDDIEREMAISAGLRDRISSLEGKRRSLRDERDALSAKQRVMNDQLENIESVLLDTRTLAAKDRADLEEAVRNERAMTNKLKAEMEEMKRHHDATRAELKVLQDAQQMAQAVKSPPRILQPREANIPNQSGQAAPGLKTPTKPKLKAFPSLLASPSAPVKATGSAKQDPAQQLALMESSYLHLSQTHQSLRKAYNNLRDIHQKDIEHMKQYKVQHLAREQERKRKREEKKASRGVRSGTGSATPTEGVSDRERLVSSGEAILPTGADENLVLVEESESLPPATRNLPISRKRNPSAPANEGDTETEQDEEDLAIFVEAKPPPARDDVQLPMDAAIDARPEVSPTKRAVQPARVTPWLGTPAGKAGPSGTNRQLGLTKSRGLDPGDDDFASPPDEPSTPIATKTPLIRDRGVGDTTLLRKAILHKAVVGGSAAVETPTRTEQVRDHMEDFSTPQAQLLSRTGSSDMIATGTSSKRKLVDVAMGGLTPAEKAVKRKQIAQMPASERRELYKEYKGKGRYMRSEASRGSIREEYEIDPEQNEGASFAFHDVKRKRAERKAMHGGDCECCKDYYEAVGEIPRFNQGPVWRDAKSAEDKDEGDAVREHQNKVSRHRETWVKPPTPPGYWQIGFPSTQDVAEQNERADQMNAEKEARLRREVMQKDSKWRKKN
ncbi:hypothetical protein IAU60_004681 [Kwoniella sp. DSM 27419]